MNAYDSTLTRFNLAVNSYCAIRLELIFPHSRRAEAVLEHAKKVRDAAEEFIAAAEEKRHEHKKTLPAF